MKNKQVVLIGLLLVLLIGGGLVGVYYQSIADLEDGPRIQAPEKLLLEYDGPIPGVKQSSGPESNDP